MRKLLSTILMTSLLTLLPVEIELSWAKTPRPAQMPWTTFSGEMAKAGTGTSRMLPCVEGEVFIAKFRYLDALYIMAASVETGRLVFVYDPNPSDVTAPPTEIGFGTVDMKTPGAADTIPPLQWRHFDPELDGNACRLLFPPTA